MTVIRGFLAILFFLLTILSGPVFGGESVSFTWAFFLKPKVGQVKSMAFDTPEMVEGGELLRIYLELHKRSFLYVYLFDARKDLYLVFPASGSFYNGDVPVGYKTYIPSGREWFSLDNLKGTERFYLLASTKRLIELEKMTDRFLATADQTLKLKLLKMIEKIAGDFSGTPEYEVDPVPVHQGEWLNTSAFPPPRVSAHKVKATGNYGMILDMINNGK